MRELDIIKVFLIGYKNKSYVASLYIFKNIWFTIEIFNLQQI